MKILFFFTFIVMEVLVFNGCSSSSSNRAEVEAAPIRDYNYTDVVNQVPTLVVIMNWNDYSENNPTLWHDKIFNYSANSLNRYYYEALDGKVGFIPVKESSGIADDGVIIVNMGKNHPGDFNDDNFRDVEIRNAITNNEVDNNVDFSRYDSNKDGYISAKEMQIFFAVAGGEAAYGDGASVSIWAHAWNFDSNNAPKLDGIVLMSSTGNQNSEGTYMRFGTRHDINKANEHKATIGIIAHEVGHSLLDLLDYYDDGGGSGLGYYDLMSNGAWGQKYSDNYYGETPSQMSIFNKVQADVNATLTTLNASATLTIACSKNEGVKLDTGRSNEYFMLSCRDTSMEYTDQNFESLGTGFTNNNLFVSMYHIDENKLNNNENGVQTAANHYRVAFVEKDQNSLMTSTEDIYAEFDDVYVNGDVIDTSKTRLYDGTNTNYSIEVLSSDYTNRTMTIKVMR